MSDVSVYIGKKYREKWRGGWLVDAHTLVFMRGGARGESSGEVTLLTWSEKQVMR